MNRIIVSLYAMLFLLTKLHDKPSLGKTYSNVIDETLTAVEF